MGFQWGQVILGPHLPHEGLTGNLSSRTSEAVKLEGGHKAGNEQQLTHPEAMPFFIQ